jgi:hypothetical protein
MTLLFDEQRIRFVEELLDSTQSHSIEYGVLFSGPNGVGKSAICLEAALFCFAMGVPCAYIPKAANWVNKSETEHQAQAYVMNQLFRQNADLIVGTHVEMEPHFLEQLRGEPAQAQSYKSLTDALEDRLIRPIALIADESHMLTKASLGEKKFFASDFIVWTGPSYNFCSMLCASAHGLREFTLPSGEENRLRFVNPMRPEDAKILLLEPGSPFRHEGYAGADREALRAYVLKLTGSMPRDLSQFATDLGNANQYDQSDTSIDEIRMRIATIAPQLTIAKQDAAWKHWINQSNSVAHQVSPSHKFAALLSLFRGTAKFSPDVKDLYDYGLVKRVKLGMVVPCSLMASDALSYVFAHLRVEDDHMPLSQWNGAERGFQFELRVLRAIVRQGALSQHVRVHRACSPGSVSDLYLGASVIQTSRLDDLSDIEALPGQKSLWIPSKSNSPFDGIIMPALEQLGIDPIVVFDPSVTEPYDVERRKKAKKLSELCGVLKQRLKLACSPVPLVMWDGDVSSLQREDGAKPVQDMPDDVMIMDRAGLRALGLVL